MTPGPGALRMFWHAVACETCIDAARAADKVVYQTPHIPQLAVVVDTCDTQIIMASRDVHALWSTASQPPLHMSSGDALE